MNKVIWGDALHALKRLDDDSVDLLCTDPPYGYSFMGKDWDKAVPSTDIWRECLRVLKPGAFAFIMSAPRQDVLSQMIVRIGQAGFDTDFTSIYWTYASGFPKAMNIGKAVDKRQGNEREIVGPGKRHNSKDFGEDIYGKYKGGVPIEGSYGGFQPKPAVEVIIVAMKPLSEKTFVDQALKNGKGVTWLDDCRVPAADAIPAVSQPSSKGGIMGADDGRNGKTYDNTRRRFPANLLVSDDVLNDGVQRISKYGTQTAGNKEYMGRNSGQSSNKYAGDTGSYSRYFDLDAWAKTLPFLIVPKASKGEKNEGLQNQPERKNNHPTVKPLKLMSYLITLGSRPGDLVLDPFLGSGTTAIAAKKLGRQYIGIEMEIEYVDIAQARLKVTPEPLPLKEKELA